MIGTADRRRLEQLEQPEVAIRPKRLEHRRPRPLVLAFQRIDQGGRSRDSGSSGPKAVGRVAISARRWSINTSRSRTGPNAFPAQRSSSRVDFVHAGRASGRRLAARIAVAEPRPGAGGGARRRCPAGCRVVCEDGAILHGNHGLQALRGDGSSEISAASSGTRSSARWSFERWSASRAPASRSCPRSRAARARRHRPARSRCRWSSRQRCHRRDVDESERRRRFAGRHRGRRSAPGGAQGHDRCDGGATRVSEQQLGDLIGTASRSPGRSSSIRRRPRGNFSCQATESCSARRRKIIPALARRMSGVSW